jgi:hypothetical protein
MNILGRFSRKSVIAGVAALAVVAVAAFGGVKIASAAQPDLTVQRITVNNATKGVTVRFNNAGAPTGSWFYTSLAICDTTTWTCEYKYLFHGAMAGGTDGLVTATGFSGANYAVACVDRHWTNAAVDTKVAEASEVNNCETETFAPIP